MSDLQATGADPATQYLPVTGPPPTAPYNEDRQVTLTGGPGTQMYHTVNAQFVQSSQTWNPVSSAPAYAEVQNPDGSIHYYKLNSSGTWDGSGNNTVYNGVDFGMVPMTINPNFDNGPALQKALLAAISGGGGTVLIPSGTYNVKTKISHTAGSQEDVGIVIAGTGGGAELAADFGSNGGTLFSLTDFNNTGNGVRFHNLRFSYKSPGSMTKGAAISLVSCQNITCRECFFYNCPQSLSTDSSSLQCGLIDCTIQFDVGAANQTMVSLQGSEDFVRGCVIRETTTNPPSGCTGISMSSTNGVFIDDVHISDFDFGILVTDSLKDSFVSNTLIDVNVCAVQVITSNSTAKINNIGFSNCVFAETLTGGAGGPGNCGVIISTNGGDDTNVAGIHFDSCIAYGWGASGIKINSGQNIVISGGQYSSNGQISTVAAALRAGIAITGGSIVTITGADCSGINELWAHNIKFSAITQPTGIAISNGVENVAIVTIDGCNLQFQTGTTQAVLVAQSGAFTISTVLIRNCNTTGYASYAAVLTVTGTPSTPQVIGCAGYNDQGVPIATSFPTGSATFGSSFFPNQLGSTPYYGPVEFYVGVVSNGGVTNIKVDNHGTLLTLGSFYLMPNEKAEIDGGPPIAFLAIGK